MVSMLFGSKAMANKSLQHVDEDFRVLAFMRQQGEVSFLEYDPLLAASLPK